MEQANFELKTSKFRICIHKKKLYYIISDWNKMYLRQIDFKSLNTLSDIWY